ncbi:MULTISPECIES: tetratricopeptide repeat protein [Roseobacteraceae]|jgi:Flp pilus assembly protein TadD|uniref:Tetratricopeptide repeat protein n=1 Tax=Pseudosulfitobacter pseudonitzschiae TaxID=1402135 RepID=A0A221K1W7_9RHOB|nr:MULTISPECIES: tetratricopeptide repeat protein [Roseobacteraceae]ASM72985.1 tetratricopeptide repeat protein [Pseudosulfitobacter pseudonitzschiae]
MRSATKAALVAALMAHGLAACSSGGLSASSDGVYAPGVDTSKQAVDGIEVGHRLIAAGEFELAIKAFTRAALDEGMNAEILSGLGTANLGLGRLGQAEKLLRRATAEYDAWPEIYNNLGVVLMESGQTAEAEQIFRKAYALDDGESTLIRDNLRLALAKTENSVTVEPENNNYKLVRRGSSDYLIRPAS